MLVQCAEHHAQADEPRSECLPSVSTPNKDGVETVFECVLLERDRALVSCSEVLDEEVYRGRQVQATGGILEQRVIIEIGRAHV